MTLHIEPIQLLPEVKLFNVFKIWYRKLSISGKRGHWPACEDVLLPYLTYVAIAGADWMTCSQYGDHQQGNVCALFECYTSISAIAVIVDRTACSILTLFIVIATSRPLNKKSVRCQSADPTITADLRPQSTVRTSAAPAG